MLFSWLKSAIKKVSQLMFFWHTDTQTNSDIVSGSDSLSNDITDNQTTQEQKTSFKELFISSVTTVIVVLAIVIPVRMYIGKPFLVNGQSMDPAFATWDYLLIDVFTYQFLHDPERGDIVVFKAPISNHKYFIKRIVALPNERIEIKDGRVIIYNNEFKEGFELKEPYVANYNKSYNNVNITLKDDEYFVMGDNRKGSYDSRFWGPLKKDAIVGRAFARLFPFTKIDLFPADYKYNETQK